MKALGFADVFEVAVGADLCATQEAIDFIQEVPESFPLWLHPAARPGP